MHGMYDIFWCTSRDIIKSMVYPWCGTYYTHWIMFLPLFGCLLLLAVLYSTSHHIKNWSYSNNYPPTTAELLSSAC